MSIDYSFDSSITTYKAIYHHFLDGLINTSVGNKLENVLGNLYDLDIIGGRYLRDFSILFTEINSSLNYSLKFC